MVPHFHNCLRDRRAFESKAHAIKYQQNWIACNSCAYHLSPLAQLNAFGYYLSKSPLIRLGKRMNTFYTSNAIVMLMLIVDVQPHGTARSERANEEQTKKQEQQLPLLWVHSGQHRKKKWGKNRRRDANDAERGERSGWNRRRNMVRDPVYVRVC